MPEQFVIPQFIDVEDKIIGPISVRQFVVLLGVLLLEALLYQIFSFGLFLIVGVPLLVIGIVFAFLKVNGVAFHFFLLNVVQTLRRPSLRVWDKSSIQMKATKKSGKKKGKELIEELPVKTPLSSSRLSELSLVVNTGGVYQPDDYL